MEPPRPGFWIHPTAGRPGPALGWGQWRAPLPRSPSPLTLHKAEECVALAPAEAPGAHPRMPRAEPGTFRLLSILCLTCPTAWGEPPCCPLPPGRYLLPYAHCSDCACGSRRQAAVGERYTHAYTHTHAYTYTYRGVHIHTHIHTHRHSLPSPAACALALVQSCLALMLPMHMHTPPPFAVAALLSQMGPLRSDAR